MKLMNQPFNGQLGDQLIKLLDSPNYHTLNIVVAFAKSSGVLRIKNSLENFRKRGGKVNVFVGVDLEVTSYEALTALLLCTNSLNVVHSEKVQIFHTKIYQFLGKEKGIIVVGSHNLTRGGLWTNFESSAHISLDMSNSEDIEMLKVQEDYFKSLVSLKDSFMPITTSDDVDKLLQNGYIVREVSQQVRLAKTTAKDESQVRLFGNGFPAAFPRGGIPTKETAGAPSEVLTGKISELKNDESDTIWFQTSKLTGGSRNILDLSMKSLVERGEPIGTFFDLGDPGFMRGGVEFFGINPSDKGDHKYITLNFEGVDYTQNEIFFASANGTWRLRINGVSSADEKITDAFRSKDEGHYLVKKVVTFTKVENDYYSISVYPESELENFVEASSILARNGPTKNARRLGLL